MIAIPPWAKIALVSVVLSSAFTAGWTANGWRLNGKHHKAEIKTLEDNQLELAGLIDAERRLRVKAERLAAQSANQLKAREERIAALELDNESLKLEREHDAAEIEQRGQELAVEIFEDTGADDAMRPWDDRLRDFANGSDYQGLGAASMSSSSSDSAASLVSRSPAALGTKPAPVAPRQQQR